MSNKAELSVKSLKETLQDILDVPYVERDTRVPVYKAESEFLKQNGKWNDRNYVEIPVKVGGKN